MEGLCRRTCCGSTWKALACRLLGDMGECTCRDFTGDIGGCSTAPMAVGAAFICTWEAAGATWLGGHRETHLDTTGGAAASVYYGTRRSLITGPCTPSKPFSPDTSL